MPFCAKEVIISLKGYQGNSGYRKYSSFFQVSKTEFIFVKCLIAIISWLILVLSLHYPHQASSSTMLSHAIYSFIVPEKPYMTTPMHLLIFGCAIFRLSQAQIRISLLHAKKFIWHTAISASNNSSYYPVACQHIIHKPFQEG